MVFLENDKAFEDSRIGGSRATGETPAIIKDNTPLGGVETPRLVRSVFGKGSIFSSFRTFHKFSLFLCGAELNVESN